MIDPGWERSAARAEAWLYDLLVCPSCRGDLALGRPGTERIRCHGCGKSYPWMEHIPILIEQEDMDQDLFALANCWNRAASVWSSRIEKSQAALNASEKPLLEAALGLVLEIGCGDGRLFSRYEQRGLKVIGLDFSSEMLARAAPKGFPLVLADAHRLPLRDGAIDTILVPFATIRYLDYEVFFNESFRLLRENGVLGFVAWNSFYNIRYRSQRETDWRRGRDVRRIEDVLSPLSASGFGLESLSGVFSLPAKIAPRLAISLPGRFGATVSRDIVFVARKKA